MGLADRVTKRNGGGNTRPAGGFGTMSNPTPQVTEQVGSLDQYDSIAATDAISRNAVGAANKLKEAQLKGIDVSGPEFEDIRRVAETGLVADEDNRSGFMKSIGIIDGMRQTVNLAIQDIVNGVEEKKGYESPGLGDYVDALFGGVNNSAALKKRTGLDPADSNVTFSLFGWDLPPDATWEARAMRGIGMFAYDMAIDPITYITFGLSGLGKKVALESATGTVNRAFRNVVAKAATTEYEVDLLKRLPNIVKDFSDDIIRRFDSKQITEINKWMSLKHGEEAAQLSLNATAETAASFMNQNADDLVEMALQHQLTKDIIDPVINKRFGDINKLASKDMDAFIQGGIRITFPFTKGGLMGGYVIPNTQGLGRKLFGDRIRGLFDNVLPKMGVDTQKIRNAVGDLHGFFDVDTPLINAVAKGELSTWQYSYIREAFNNFANAANKAEMTSFINGSRKRLEDAAQLVGLDDTQFEQVLRHVHDRINFKFGPRTPGIGVDPENLGPVSAAAPRVFADPHEELAHIWATTDQSTLPGVIGNWEPHSDLDIYAVEAFRKEQRALQNEIEAFVPGQTTFQSDAARTGRKVGPDDYAAPGRSFTDPDAYEQDLLARMDDLHMLTKSDQVRATPFGQFGEIPQTAQASGLDLDGNALFRGSQKPTLLDRGFDKGVSDAAEELASLINSAFDKYRRLLYEVAPQLSDDLFKKGFPQMMSGKSSRLLESLAVAGAADDLRSLRRMADAGDHGAFLLAEILGAIGRGGRIEAQMGSHARTGAARYGHQVVTLLNDVHPELGSTVFIEARQRMMGGNAAANAVADLTLSNTLATKADFMSSPELNELIMPHVKRLAEEHGISTKGIDEIFNTNPLEVANRYIENMHEAINTYTLTNALRQVGLMTPEVEVVNNQQLLKQVQKYMDKNRSRIDKAMAEKAEEAQKRKQAQIKRATMQAEKLGFKADNIGALRRLQEFVSQPRRQFLANRANATRNVLPETSKNWHTQNLVGAGIKHSSVQPRTIEEFLAIAPPEELRQYAAVYVNSASKTPQDFRNSLVERITAIATSTDGRHLMQDEIDELGSLLREVQRNQGRSADTFLPKLVRTAEEPKPILSVPVNDAKGHRVEVYGEGGDTVRQTTQQYLGSLPPNPHASQLLNPEMEAPWGGRLISNDDGTYDVPISWVSENIVGADDMRIARGLEDANPPPHSIMPYAEKPSDAHIPLGANDNLTPVSMDDFDTDLLNNGQRTPIEVTINDDGIMSLGDGHHRVAAFERLDPLANGFDRIRVRISHDPMGADYGVDVSQHIPNPGYRRVVPDIGDGQPVDGWVRTAVIRDAEGKPISSIRVVYYKGTDTHMVTWGGSEELTARTIHDAAPDIWRGLTKDNPMSPETMMNLMQSNSITDAGATLFHRMAKAAFESMPDGVLETISRQPAEYTRFVSRWYDFREEYDDLIRAYARTYGSDLATDPNFRQMAGTDTDVTDLLDHLRDVAKDLDIPGLQGVFPDIDNMRTTVVNATPGFVSPSVFALGGDAVENMVIQKDMARWLRNLAANNAALWTPQGIAVAKANMNNVVRAWKGLATVSRPSFHLRNTFSAAWNNMAIGVRSKDYYMVRDNALKMRRAMINDHMSFVEAISTLPAEAQPYFMAAQREQIFNGFAQSEFRKLTSAQKDKAMKFMSLINPYNPDDFGLTKMGSLFMESIEDFMRMSAFVRWYNPADPSSSKLAREMVEAVHFNYAKLTPFETGIKSIVPFFVWTRRNIPLQMQLMLENPKMIQRYRNLLASAQAQFPEMPQDEYGESKYLSELAVGTNITFNSNTPHWARIMFDPDLPVRDLLDIDPTSASSMFDTFERMIGPQFTLPFTLRDQADFGNVNAPAPIHLVLKSLAKVGMYNETTDGNVRIPYYVKTLYDTIFPFAGETVDPLLNPVLGSQDPNEAQRQGISLEDDSTLTQTVKGILAPFGRAVGVSYQTPLDTRTANYDTDQQMQQQIRELRMRGEL